MRLSFSILLSILFTLLSVGEACSRQTGELAPPTEEEIEEARSAPLFTSHETLQITLEADFASMRKEDRDQDSEERPGIMRWADPDGTPHEVELQIGTRGNFRLQKRNCDFPPLRLNLKKETTKGTIFETQDKLKLVVTCKPRQDYWEQYVLLEYLTYRTLNLLTDLSFRVRLAQVTYVDSSGDDDTFTRHAFIIEDDDALALRHGGRKMDWNSGQLNPRLLDARPAILVDVFQYMIGNTDWSGVEMHNIELVRMANGRPSTVPYDFDFSGMVDTRYAEPDASLPIRSVRDRYFRGFCPEDANRSDEDYQAIYDHFRAKKGEIMALWQSQGGLDRDRMEDSVEYLEDFFETIENPRSIESRMMSTCRRIPG